MSNLTMKEARKATGYSGEHVARLVGCDRATLYRIEAGITRPKRETARKLFRLYMGHVPLAAIYDPEYCLGDRLDGFLAPWGNLPTTP